VRPRPRPVALLALALAVSACTGSSTPSPTAGGSLAAGPSAVATGAPPGSSTASAGTGGGAAASATGGAPSAATSGASAAADWPTYHRDNARSGYDPTFPAFGGSIAKAWSAALDGAVYAQPIVVHGLAIVATEGDTVYGIDPSGGQVRWMRNLGTPVPLAALPCGNIDPLGITGTPAFDERTGSVFAVAEVTGPKHVLFALDAATGAVRWSRDVDVPGTDPAAQQQRPALTVAGGYVYAGFGGLLGDCGDYKGKVVGVPVDGKGDTLAYVLPVDREGAVWATGGPQVGPDGNLYVSSGNGSATGGTYDGSDSVMELSPTLDRLSFFAPSSWAQDNARDLDLGSLSPVLVGTAWVFIAGKRGTGYTLRQGDLGGIGGEVDSAPVCNGFGGSAVRDQVVYVPCTGGVRQVTIGSDGSIAVGWKADSANGPPVIGGGAIWSVDTDAGELFALSPTSGATLARATLGDVPHFASPTLWDGLVIVGTMSGVVALRPSG